MNKHLKYLSYVIRHKFWVGYYCFKEGLIWRGLIHDWSKFLLCEWIAYAKYFYGSGSENRRKKKEEAGAYKPYGTNDQKFDFFWLSHQHRNDHHWQWWILPEDDGGLFALPMKEKAITEMICDWRGASRAQGHKNNTPCWYAKNKSNMKIHYLSRFRLEDKLRDIFGSDIMDKAFDPKTYENNFDKEKL